MLPWLAAALLAGCGEAGEPAAVYTVAEGPLRLEVIAEGTLESSKATPLLVPGQDWAERRLLWMKPEGSIVEKGELLARFSTEEGRLDLAQALIELERNTLARAAKQGELGVNQDQVSVDLSQVAVQLGIAQRYAGADLSTLARNEVLDAIEDVDYLETRRTILRWKQAQFGQRGHAESALLDAQRATIQQQAQRKRADLQALELHAPHAGLMLLSEDWSGEKPSIGSTQRAGMEFGRLPNLDALEVELALPQLQAQGVRVGDAVELAAVGRLGQRVRSRVRWIASAAKVMSRQSPVKYVTLKADVPAGAARRHGWVPGQRLRAHVILFEGARALAVPNVALRYRAGKHYVRVRDGGRFVRREVTLGARDSARSQVLAGLSAGDEVLLVAAGERDDDAADEDTATAPETARDDASGGGNGGKTTTPGVGSAASSTDAGSAMP